MRLAHVFISALAVASFFAGPGAPVAHAQISDDVVRIGVLNDQSGLYADLGGPGSVTDERVIEIASRHRTLRYPSPTQA